MIQLKGRQKIIQGIFITVIVIFLMKLFYIQIINSRYKYSARNNAIRYEVQQAARGLIYDRNGKQTSKIDELKTIFYNWLDDLVN